jgi:hypothetical protein
LQDKTLKKAKKTSEDHYTLWMQEKSHKIQDCPNSQVEPYCSSKISQTGIHNRSNRSSSSFVSQVKGPIISKTRQGLQEASQRQENKCMSKIRGRICYSCGLKGHLSQDCPNGNKHESKLVNSTPNMHDNSNSLYDTRKVISSPSTRAIWVPKSLMTNLKGPNET